MAASPESDAIGLRPPTPAARRAIVLAHFDPHGEFDPHVRHAVRAYRPHAATVIIVSNGGGRLPGELAGLVDGYLPRANVGYDFAAWQAGLFTLDRGGHDEIICANDSVYGPLFDLGPALADSRVTSADLWGMVLSDQATGRNRPRIPHLQSWFFAMRKPLIESSWFEGFWSGVGPLPTKREVVERFEIGMSQSAAAAGFQIAALYDATTAAAVRLREVLPHLSLADPRRSWRLIRKSRRTPHNPSELVWWRLLEAGVPFVKVGLFRVNHYGIDLRRVTADLRRRTPFDLGLITGHLARCG
ncbi:MAG: rhamnan synthesis F family protein [Planctomycetaceae bacterium]